MEDKKRAVESEPVEARLERSLDGQRASIVFRTQDGGEYIFKFYRDSVGGYETLAIEEITAPA